MLKRIVGAGLLGLGLLLLASPLLIGQTLQSFLVMGVIGVLAGLVYLFRII